MSIYDLTEQDIETIKASDEPPQLLAWRYNVAQKLIERLRPWRHRIFPGKLHDGQGGYRQPYLPSRAAKPWSSSGIFEGH